MGGGMDAQVHEGTGTAARLAGALLGHDVGVGAHAGAVAQAAAAASAFQTALESAPYATNTAGTQRQAAQARTQRAAHRRHKSHGGLLGMGMDWYDVRINDIRKIRWAVKIFSLSQQKVFLYTQEPSTSTYYTFIVLC